MLGKSLKFICFNEIILVEYIVQVTTRRHFVRPRLLKTVGPDTSSDLTVKFFRKYQEHRYERLNDFAFPRKNDLNTRNTSKTERFENGCFLE